MSLEKLVPPGSKESLIKEQRHVKKHMAASLKLPKQRQPEHPKKQWYCLIKNLMINRIFIVLK